MPAGSLTVVGTGIRVISQITPEARTAIEQADRVLYVAVDPVTPRWLKQRSPNAEPLNHLFARDKDRLLSYREIAEHAVAAARGGAHVCLVFYGHPGVFVYPAHRAIRAAAREGLTARMLPAISAEDCLFADLGVDPAVCGCQSFEAGDFLYHRRVFDPRSVLLLWQIGVIGETKVPFRVPNPRGLQVLTARLGEHYPADHPAIVYEAAQFPGCHAGIQRVTVSRLADARITTLSTLYVPPLPSGAADQAVLEAIRASPE
jgi:uncharacterized protein YabN with tetrapyrrole methylase and pyrophosphatase domain